VLISISKLSYSFREQLMGINSQINSQIVAAAILTLAIAGCTVNDTPEATNTPPAATIPQTAAEKPEEKTPFANPVVSSQKDQAIKANNPGLIESTRGDLRVDLAQKGRTDPFAEIIKPLWVPIAANSEQKEVPKLPPLPTPQQTGTNQAQGGQNGQARVQITTPPPQPKPPLTPVLPMVLPQVVAKEPVKPVLPPAPKPEDAQAVLVSGIVVIGKETQAIIKVPEELTSRYVQAGQRLGNGVLIKRIEMNRGSNPVVVFEQFGIEVAKAVGEKPSTEPAKSEPAKSEPAQPAAGVSS
jgi:hypothetical protein